LKRRVQKYEEEKRGRLLGARGRDVHGQVIKRRLLGEGP